MRPDGLGAGALGAGSRIVGSLFHLEALAVRALHLGGVGLMGAHLDGRKAAILGVLAVMGAVADRALNALVGGAVAVGAIVHHKRDPPG